MNSHLALKNIFLSVYSFKETIVLVETFHKICRVIVCLTLFLTISGCSESSEDTTPDEAPLEVEGTEDLSKPPS